MKIASQFVSTAQNVSAKTSSSPDIGTDFHSAFTAAANGSNHGNASQVKTSKPQTRDTKLQTSESKKKEAKSEPAISDAAAPAVLAPKEPVAQGASKAPWELPVNGDGLSQTFDQRLDAAEAANGTVSGTVTGAVEATGGKLAGVPSTGTESPGGVTQAESLPSIKSGVEEVAMVQPGQSQFGDLQREQAAALVPVSQTGIQKPAHVGDGSGASKPLEASNPAADAGSTDPSVMAAQHAVAAMMQSIAATSSLASPGSGVEFGTAPMATGKASSVNPMADTTRGAASRLADSPAKGKATASDLRSKRTDDAKDDTQPNNEPAGTANAVAAKVNETSGSANRSAGESKGAIDGAGFQQISQAAQAAASDHGSVSARSVSVSEEPTVQAAQVPSGNQAMPGVNSAQLVQSMHSSEMKLGMQSVEFGNISISTSLNHQAISAQISIDHSELGRALAVHLPAIEEKLGSAYGVQAKVELRGTNNPSQSNDSGYSNSGQQAKEQRQSQSQAAVSVIAGGAMFERMAGPGGSSPTFMAAGTSRLDIRI